MIIKMSMSQIPKNFLAQVPTQSPKDLGGTFKGIGPLGNPGVTGTDVKPAAVLFNKLISIVIGFMTVIAGLWFTFQLIIGAFEWITAGGDTQKLQSAQKKILNAIIGLVVVVAAVFLIDLIGSLLGIDILSPAKFLINIFN